MGNQHEGYKTPSTLDPEISVDEVKSHMLSESKDTGRIPCLTEDWIQMTHRVLALKRIPSDEIKLLLKRTYQVLYQYRKNNSVPKAICEMLLEMDGFLYFASLITDREFDDTPYLYQSVHSVAEALKIGFFQGEYECEYPLLKATDANEKPFVLDLENGYLGDLF